MPKWLQGMVAPTLMLWLYAATVGIAWGLDPVGGEMPKRADVVSNVTLPVIIASWVMTDARKRGRKLCYDYDSFVYFASFIIVPIYLFQTRGMRAFLTLLCFVGIWFIAPLAAGVVFLVRHFRL